LCTLCVGVEVAGIRRTVPSTVATRFRALCNERGHPRADLDGFIKNLFRDNVTKAEKAATNVANFLRNGSAPSATVRDILKAYARDRLGVELRDCWFEESWHPSGLIDAFCAHNAPYAGISEGICGDFVHLSRKMNTEAEKTKAVRHGKLRIERQGTGFFRFDMGSERSPTSGDNPYSGYLVCHSDTLFLTGFDQMHHVKMLFLVLRKPPPSFAMHGVSLIGMQAGTLPFLAMPNGRAFAKRIILIDEPRWITKWQDGSNVPDDVINWLYDGGLGFDVELVVPHVDEDA
jgi:hypothetical protein